MITYSFKVDSLGRLFHYQGNIVCEDEHFISINDRYIGLIRLAKNKIISQEAIK